MDGARREHQRAQRREALLDAAFELVEETGLEGLTIAGLAKVTRAAASGLYHYFPSKSALLAAMQERALATFDARLAERLKDANALTPSGERRADALRLVLVPVVAYLEEHDTREAQLMDAFLSAYEPVLDDADAARVEVPVRAVLGRCAALLEAASRVEALSVGDAARRAHVLWITAFALAHFRKRDRLLPPALQSAAVAREMLLGLLVGWGAPADAAHAALTAHGL